MGRTGKRIEDQRLLKLIRAFLNAGGMENGLAGPSVEGTPQGGPLSQPAGGSTGDGERHAIHRARAQGECGEGPEKHGYPGGATAGAKVPWVQLYRRSGGQARHRAETLGSVSATNPGDRAPGDGRRHRNGEREDTTPPPGGVGRTGGASAAGRKHRRQWARALPAPRPCRWGFPMLTSNSNRRVRTRVHSRMAGVGR
jgi:hypothetical protein